MLSNIVAILFYGTLFLYIFIKIYNAILIKRYDCKDSYKKQKEKIKQTRFSKVMRVLLIVSLIGIILYIPYGITNFYFSLAFMIVGKDYRLIDFFDILFIILYTIYFILITYKLYIEIPLNKFLRKYKKM